MLETTRRTKIVFKYDLNKILTIRILYISIYIYL